VKREGLERTKEKKGEIKIRRNKAHKNKKEGLKG
jgi:hypothetical protein